MTHTTRSYNIFDEERALNNCCHFCQTEGSCSNIFGQNPTAYYTLEEELQPFVYMYILNLFIAPDMKRYLLEMPMTDDIYQLPLHLQRLVLEARMEFIASRNNGAYQRLEKVRGFVRSIAGPEDIAGMIDTLKQLVYDEDELFTIVGQ
ncbi:hypothetical protein BY458DRAFT_497660 [Sporodiniella umbellata]|nr:hypothetical protein BY458DRAFT_497660 [Sporodiniella umbellata]